MLSFSSWSLMEAISIWLTAWADMFIIGSLLNQYYLGLYRTSTAMVNSLMSLITAAVVPVLFSALSRLQSDPAAFNRTYFKAQRMVSILVFPLGIGVFLYSDLATQILLGDQWYETSDIIGIWALTSAIMIVFGHLCSEVYRSKGKPRLSFLAQMLHLGFLIPVCIISAKYGFWALVYARSVIRLQSILVDFIIMKFSIGIPIGKTFRNVASTALSSIAMGFFGYILNSINDGIVWDLISIMLCIIFYFAVLSLFPSMRMEIRSLIWKLKPNMGRRNDITEKI
jgi:PST family polysaccharide transporter